MKTSSLRHHLSRLCHGGRSRWRSAETEFSPTLWPTTRPDEAPQGWAATPPFTTTSAGREKRRLALTQRDRTLATQAAGGVVRGWQVRVGRRSRRRSVRAGAANAGGVRWSAATPSSYYRPYAVCTCKPISATGASQFLQPPNQMALQEGLGKRSF
jgi:hypothetical protein